MARQNLALVSTSPCTSKGSHHKTKCHSRHTLPPEEQLQMWSQRYRCPPRAASLDNLPRLKKLRDDLAEACQQKEWANAEALPSKCFDAHSMDMLTISENYSKTRYASTCPRWPCVFLNALIHGFLSSLFAGPLIKNSLELRFNTSTSQPQKLTTPLWCFTSLGVVKMRGQDRNGQGPTQCSNNIKQSRPKICSRTEVPKQRIQVDISSINTK